MSRRAGNAPVLDSPLLDPNDATSPSRRVELLRTLHPDRAADPPPASGWPKWLPRPGVGPRGRYAGRVPLPLRIPTHTESTRSLCGLYPWLAGAGLPQLGPLIGRDRFSRQRFCYDPWQLYAAGLLEDAGIIETGAIGSGKTSLSMSLLVRSLAFGHSFAVPADMKGEWVTLAEKVGGTVLRLGPGMFERLNALAMPAKPDGIAPEQWWMTVRTHWEELIASLVRTLLPGQRELAPFESTAIETALTTASRWDEVGGAIARLQPLSLGRLVDQLRDPDEHMADVIGMPVERLKEELRDIYLTLRRLTAGSLGGLVDDEREDNQIDVATPTVVDLSRVQASDASIALVMACTQSTIELAAAHRVARRFIVYDEAWRLMRFPALVGRINAGQRLSRKNGGSTVLITHRITDLELGGAESRGYAMDLLGDCSTRIVYRQRADAIDATARLLDLSDAQSQFLPQLQQGCALWQIRNEPYMIDHFVPKPSAEWDLVNSDAAMVADYHSLADVPSADLFAGV
ncbi:hypothetical protein CLV47_12345 [Antricoccus suffuscus]|uniref:Uncharacterized protein n=1 Tax=Antricoccus suffuscus TaxID=1629062 RepID=A0A2T0ZEP1_9ACTN|nr:ATP-binding protein [Antricoccus suffuscus]PRZ34813.1 hypothetical protein CLV47_12345 [Antricoccus suffuscus]